MKPYHYALAFLIIFLSLTFAEGFHVSEAVQTADSMTAMDKVFDEAVDAAVGMMAAVSQEGADLSRNRDRAVDAFFASLYASLGIVSDYFAQRELEMYVPVILVSDEEGFYVYYFDDETGTAGAERSVRRWTEKIPYAYDDGQLIYRFVGNDEVYVCDRAGIFPDGYRYGTFSITISMLKDYPWYEHLLLSGGSDGLLLTHPEELVRVRHEVIAGLTEEYVGFYVNGHNRIAEEYGLNYQFEMPVLADEEYSDSAQPMFMAFMQGYPIEGVKGTYNRFAVGNARLSEAVRMYITTDENGIRLYHYEGCRYLEECQEKEGGYYTAVECGKAGAYACPYCCHDTGLHAP